MGRNLARNFARHGYTVAVHNRTAARTHALVEEFGSEGTFVPAETAEEFVAALETTPPPDDHGEGRRGHRRGDRGVRPAAGARRHDHRRRQRALRRHPPPRGGAARARHPLRRRRGLRRRGGRAARPVDHARRLRGVLRRARPDAGGDQREGGRRARAATHIGTDGAGHFVKMVHNGIEYADMQLIAEAYDLLRKSPTTARPQIAEVFRAWNKGRLDSYLIEITAEVLAHTDADDRQAVRGHRRRRRRAEGHRPLDRADRAGPGLAGRPRSRRPRSPASPPAGPSCAPPTAALPGGTEHPLRAHETERFTSPGRAGPLRLQGHRLRPGLDDDPGRGRGVRLGHRPGARSRGSGAAAASSAPRSSTGSAPPTPADPTLPSLLSEPEFAGEIADAQVPWREVSPRRRAAASRSRRSRPRWRTTTRCAPTGCPRP